MTLCACGCQTPVTKRNSQGQLNRFIAGHANKANGAKRLGKKNNIIHQKTAGRKQTMRGFELSIYS